MELISESKINEIRNSADIVDIISSYNIPLKVQGKNYFCLCPFHDDHTPSMSISKDRQIYKCFVCNKGGNVFNFVSDYENISFPEAVKRVADKVGIPLDYTPVKVENTKFKEDYEIMDYSAKIFQNNLNSKDGVKAKEYLGTRNINDEIIKTFQIGYSLNDNKYLYNALRKKDYSLTKLDDLGLINKNGLEGYDRFTNRIMIPITNLDGKVVGFTGRIFNGEDAAKYINTKETEIYKKGNILFNYYNAKSCIREEKEVILVEGNMDAIRMFSSGIKNVLALMGTNITKEQISILKKLHVPIILMLDNDNAGEMATLNIGDELLKSNVKPKVVRLSGVKDPDEYIVKMGVDKFRDVIKHSINFLDYKMDYLKNNHNLNNTDELVTYVKQVLEMIKDEDNITKEITIQKLANDYGLDLEFLKKEITLSKEEKEEAPKPRPPKRDKYSICANTILYYLMSDSKYLKIFNKRLGYLKNKEERYLVEEIEYYIKCHGKINLADFISYAENDDKIRDMVNNISGIIFDSELKEEVFLEYIEALNNILNKESTNKIKEKIKETQDINEQIDNINKQIKMMKKRIEAKKEV